MRVHWLRSLNERVVLLPEFDTDSRSPASAKPTLKEQVLLLIILSDLRQLHAAEMHAELRENMPADP